jgi:hypothetical protein
MDVVAPGATTSNPLAGGAGRQKARRPSITEMDIHTFNAHNAVVQSGPEATLSAEELQLSERVAHAATLYMNLVTELNLTTHSPGWWPTGESRAANLYLVASGEGLSGAAKVVRVVSSCIIFVASLMCCVASVDCGGSKCGEIPAWLKVESICLVYFSVEYVTRLLTAHARPVEEQVQSLERPDGTKEGSGSACASTRSWVFELMNLVDLCAILPFMVEVLVSAMMSTDEAQSGPYQVVRILRILRVLRVIKLAEVSDSMMLFGKGIKRSRDYIITLALTLVIITILFASFIFHFESGEIDLDVAAAAARVEETAADGRAKPPSAPGAAPAATTGVAGWGALEEAEDNFLSVPDVFWFCVSEITTVGNSSKSPATVVGQALAIILACFGVFYLSFAQAVIVNSFQEVLREHARTDNGAKQLKRIFDTMRKDQYDRVRCVDLHRAVRRYDAALALSLEPFLALDDLELQKEASREQLQRQQTAAGGNAASAQQQNGGGGGGGGFRSSSRNSRASQAAVVGSIDYPFFAAVMQDARAKRAAQGGDKIVDLESIAMSVELIKEDQDLLREEMHTFFAEQSHIMLAIAKNLKVPLKGHHMDADSFYPLPADKKYHFFISHSQATGGDQANLITSQLEKRGLKIWYDNNMDEITAEGMEKGVSESKAMIVLLTNGMMERSFCQKEMSWALTHGLTMVGVSEQDPRRGAVDFGKERERAPSHLKDLIDDLEFLPFRRRQFEAEGMYTEIIKRGKFEAAAEAPQAAATAAAGAGLAAPDALSPLALPSQPFGGAISGAGAGAGTRTRLRGVSMDSSATISMTRQLSLRHSPPPGSPAPPPAATAGGGGGTAGEEQSPQPAAGTGTAHVAQSRARESAKQHAALLDSVVTRTSSLRTEQRAPTTTAPVPGMLSADGTDRNAAAAGDGEMSFSGGGSGSSEDEMPAQSRGAHRRSALSVLPEPEPGPEPEPELTQEADV